VDGKVNAIPVAWLIAITAAPFCDYGQQPVEELIRNKKTFKEHLLLCAGYIAPVGTSKKPKIQEAFP
jgi:hypothetical protein